MKLKKALECRNMYCKLKYAVIYLKLLTIPSETSILSYSSIFICCLQLTSYLLNSYKVLSKKLVDKVYHLL